MVIVLVVQCQIVRTSKVDVGSPRISKLAIKTKLIIKYKNVLALILLIHFAEESELE